MLNFCTLFDRNYMERGLALYHSLEQCGDEFCLYIMAMDDACHDAFNMLNLKNAVIAGLEDMENDELRKIRKTRSARAFCWTCSSWSIRYFMEKYQLDLCTYIDADEWFFSSPYDEIEKFRQSDASAAIIGHNLGGGKYEESIISGSGKFCVQFNSFKADTDGRRILDGWCRDCAQSCIEFGDGKNFGDQKFLEKWEDEYPGKIWIYSNIGAGVAPWNMYRFKASGMTKSFYLYDKLSKTDVKVIFIHFHNLKLSSESADINVFTRYGKHDKSWILPIYSEYIRELRECRREISKISSEIDYNSMPDEKVVQKTESYLEKIRENGLFTVLRESIKYRIMKKNDYINL